MIEYRAERRSADAAGRNAPASLKGECGCSPNLRKRPQQGELGGRLRVSRLPAFC